MNMQMNGYDPHFVAVTQPIRFPDYSYYETDLARNIESNEEIIPYINFSVLVSKSRRIPILSASNIYRTSFRMAPRSGEFKADKRLHSFHQLKTADYEAFNSIISATIDKGHMTKREDVQWQETDGDQMAIMAAENTFYYPNAVPQHHRLNNGIWKLLENSIIIKGRVQEPGRVAVFTGPVLNQADPTFVSRLNDGANFQIPLLFWKVIYYIKPDSQLYHAAFLMGQYNLLKSDGLITEVEEKGVKILKPFLEFKDDNNYQIPISAVEKFTKLKFAPAIDLHAGKDFTALSLVQAKGFPGNGFVGSASSEIEGLVV